MGATKVTWGMHGENDFIGRIMGSVMNMEKTMGPIFDSGLHNLDSLIATLPKPAPGMKIYTEAYPGGKYLGIKSKVKISQLKDFFSKNFTPVMEGMKKTNAEPAGMASGLYYTWEPDKDMTEVAAAIPIKNDVKPPAGLAIFTIASGKMAVMDYMGGYSGLGKAHDAMAEYFKTNNMMQSPPVIEEYVVDPMMEKDSTKWHTRIIYFVK
jgi:effector-binding domain-containing protein